MWIHLLAVAVAGAGLRDGRAARATPAPVQVARDIGWRTEAVTSEIRAGAANLRSRKASTNAVESAADHADYTVADPALVAAELSKAEAEKADAEAHVAKVKALAEEAEKKAYDSSKAKAEAIVAKLKSDAAAYYASLEADLAAKANPAEPDAKQVAAQKAAEPYTAAELAAMKMVFQYGAKAKEVAGHAEQQVNAAHAAADKANQIQKVQGGSVMAARYMIQAHNLMGGANVNEGLAKRLWALAREINQNIPVYRAAAIQAAAAALAR
jgi:hypothetical protein